MSSSSEILLSVLDALKEPLFVLSPDHQVIFANNAFWTALPAPVENGRAALPAAPWFWQQTKIKDLSLEPFSSIFLSNEGEEFAVKLRATELSAGCILVQLLEGMQGAETNRDFHGQRLQTLGMLASGVAHDFNNILTGILGHVTYLKAASRLEGQPFESLLSVEEGAKKASEIVQQIVRFSKVESSERSRPVNLSQLVERTCRLLRGAISAKYELKVHAGLQPSALQSLPYTGERSGQDVQVLGVEAKIAQILVNLVVNARDACNEGGCIEVTVDQINDREKLAALLSTDELPCDSYAILRVDDSGHGMDPEVLERIFEPYFSTKAEHGTGIGLYTVLTIVKSFGGAIEVESARNKGTSITIYLPQLSTEPEVEVEIAPPSQRESGKIASILVVDDEYAVRNVLVLALQHLGYEVDAASSGVEALERYKDRGSSYDLVVMDMLMPQLSGERTFFILQKLNPDVKVLMISGFASEDAINSVLRHGGLGFIQKPFTIDALARKIRECV